MTSTANNVLHIMDVCVHCGEKVRLVRLEDTFGWTHDATGYYTCSLNTFVMSGLKWSEYVQGPESWLATPCRNVSV